MSSAENFTQNATWKRSRERSSQNMYFDETIKIGWNLRNVMMFNDSEIIYSQGAAFWIFNEVINISNF